MTERGVPGGHPPRPAQPGYSGTPLARKLGIGEDDEVAVLGAAEGFVDRLAAQLDGEAVIGTDINAAQFFDVIVLFVVWRAELEAELDRLRAHMAPACGLWIAWPKRASKVPTDMTDNVIREIALPTGLVDNKVCAIDDTWSALRLVIRRELRLWQQRGAHAVAGPGADPLTNRGSYGR